MNYSETINELFDPLLDLTLKETKQYLKDNEESIKDEILAAIILFLGVSKDIYKKTSITMYNATISEIRKQFRLNDTELKITQKMLGKIKVRNQYLFTNAKEFNQQILKQEHFITKVKEKEVINKTSSVLWYVLNEKTDNHCPFCVENDKGKIYSIDNAPELPNKEGHGGVGYGCYCFYILVRDKEHLIELLKKENNREFIKNWWTDSDVAPLFVDDPTNSELP